MMTTRNPYLKKRSVGAGMHLSIIAAGLLAGCGGGSKNRLPVSPLPPAPTPSSASTYTGSQNPGYWSLTLDDTQNAFSYQAKTIPAPARSSNFAISNGILNLGSVAGTVLGQAVEEPGVASVLRPGDNTAFPVAMIPQSSCFAITGKLRYIYTALPGQAVENSGNTRTTGYGTFVVSTTSDTKGWTFEDLHSYALTEYTGGPFAAGTENGSDPESFSAQCTRQNGQGTVTPNVNAPFQTTPTFQFYPSGTFVEDRSPGEGSWIGFAMPSASISPATVVAAGSYRGFSFESTDVTPVRTSPVAFAASSDGTATLVGGSFPNDDPTQAAGSQYSIALGKQDSALNGVFPNATFIAADTYGSCASVSQQVAAVKTGFDINGNLTCTALGVAIVSQVNGKYVIYFTSNDGTPDPVSSTATQAYVIQFYLYQQ